MNVKQQPVILACDVGGTHGNDANMLGAASLFQKTK
jgi:hypothetical protein